MPFYKNAEQIYAVMQGLIDHMRNETPNPVETLASSHMNVRIVLTGPDAEFTFEGRKRPVDVVYGPANGRATLEISMTADHMHLILMDEYSIKKGFSNGELKVRGPVWKAMSFAEIFEKGREYYPQVLQEQGLT
jgi:hypothetical protein